MTTESIPIPSERIPPVASDMAGSSKTVAGVLFFIAAIVLIAMIGVLSDGDTPRSRYDNDAEKAGEKVGQFIAVMLFGGIPAWFGFKSARNASRAARAGKLASTDRSYSFRLAGKFIITADGAGVPHPDLSFKINPKLRTMLLAVPRAEVVDKS